MEAIETTILPPTKASHTLTTVESEEAWLKDQASRLAKVAESPRMKAFANLLEKALNAQAKGRRQEALEELNALLQRPRAEGGFGGNLPKQIASNKKLRSAIHGLFLRTFGEKSPMGKALRLKTSADFAHLRTDAPQGIKLPEQRVAFDPFGHSGRRK